MGELKKGNISSVRKRFTVIQFGQYTSKEEHLFKEVMKSLVQQLYTQVEVNSDGYLPSSKTAG